MRNAAFVDLFILAVVFWGVWSLRFVGVDNVGLWSMLAGVAAGGVILTARKESWREIGLRSGGGIGWTISRVGEVGVLILVVGIASISLATALGHPPSTPSAIAEQPKELNAFLLDLLYGVWIGAALGEEIFFRGFLLSKFRTLFGGGRFALVAAIIAHAVWFGAGHASQGLGGMFATGMIAAALATYFMTRARGSLIPLIIGHGMVNTISQSIAYFT